MTIKETITYVLNGQFMYHRVVPNKHNSKYDFVFFLSNYYSWYMVFGIVIKSLGQIRYIFTQFSTFISDNLMRICSGLIKK